MADPILARMRILAAAEAQGKTLRPEHRQELDNYRAQGFAQAGKATGGATGPTGGRQAKTTDNDKKAYQEAIEGVETARRARRLYDNVDQRIGRFGTSRTKGQLMRMFTDEESGGLMDTIGGFAGNVIGRGTSLITAQDDDDFARLQGLSAERVGDRQKEQKGPQTDKDAGMYRMADISVSKPVATNRAIIRDARDDANSLHLRSLMTQKWISKYGSIANRSPSGIGFGDALMMAKNTLAQRLGRKGLPKAPPKKGAAKVYDINGNPI